MTRSVNDKVSGNLEIELQAAFHTLEVLQDCTLREIGSTDLLGDTTGFTCLNIGATQLIKDECLSSIDMAKDAKNRAAQRDSLLLLLLRFEDFLLSCLLLGFKLGEFLSSLSLRTL